MTIFYSADTCGFYFSAVHADIPSDAIEISDSEYESLRQGGFTNIVPGPDGRPTQGDGPPPPSEESMAVLVRRQRDRLLMASDRYVLPDFPQTKTAREAWLKYRQALRAITDQPGFPIDVAWPAPPA
jgi:hypothetical protein